MKKLTAIILMMVLVVATLSGCSSIKLADSFDKATVEATAKTVIEDINAANYDAVIDMAGEDLKAAFTAEDLKSVIDKSYIDMGAFVEYKSVAIIGQKDKTTEEDYAVAVVVVKYENQNVTYTLSFDTDMVMIGIYMK